LSRTSDLGLAPYPTSQTHGSRRPRLRGICMFRLQLFATVLLIGGNVLAATPAGKGPCTDGSQCASGTCIEVNSDSYCSQTCGSCPAGMYCDAKLFATLGMKVCVKGRSTAPAQVQSPPRLPCRTDAQCQGALVCAQFMGRRDCTMPCATDDQCKPPAMMGIKMDFLRCLPDEGNTTRRACLPRKECFSNPMACMGVNPNQMAGMANQMMGMANAMQGMAGMGDDEEDDAPAAQAPAAAPQRPSYGHSNRRSHSRHKQTVIKKKKVVKASKAMSNPRFKAFLDDLEDQSFESERSSVISLAAKRNHFSCSQVRQVIKTLDFSSERLNALRTMAPKIVDLEDSHTILSAFTFDSEKSKARSILSE